MSSFLRRVTRAEREQVREEERAVQLALFLIDRADQQFGTSPWTYNELLDTARRWRALCRTIDGPSEVGEAVASMFAGNDVHRVMAKFGRATVRDFSRQVIEAATTAFQDRHRGHYSGSLGH